MSYSFPFHATDSPLEGRSSISSSLLTPPLTPRDDHDVPYRPTETDQTSLNMRRRKNQTDGKAKKRSKHQKQHHRVTSSKDLNAQNGESFIMSQNDRHRSMSLSKLHGLDSGQVSPRASTKKPRRWTLPSKSSATRVFTPLRSTVRQTTLTREDESPALSTLRHASTNKTPKRIELTFFPEPSFGNPRSNLLSYLVSTFSRSTTSSSTYQSDKCTDAATQAPRSASVGSNSAYPVSTLPAATVFTEVSIESTFAVPDGVVARCPPRRCSTKYVTGDSNFEVIWDENDSSTASQISPRLSVAPERRTSVAVQRLEAQLAQSPKDEAWLLGQSRRISGTTSLGSADDFFEQALTPERLTQLLPRLVHATSLRDLPRSKSGSKKPKSVYNMASEASNCQVMGNDVRRSSTHDGDCFPPLRTRVPSESKPIDGRTVTNSYEARRQHSITTPGSSCQPRSRIGSMVGSSSHTRRRSSAGSVAVRYRGSSGRRRASKADEGIMDSWAEDTDETPLLGAT